MRRVVAVVLAVVGVIAAAIVAYSVSTRTHAPNSQRVGSGAQVARLPGSIHVVRSEAVGGTAACNPHITCHTSGYTPVTFRLPTTVRQYHATLTVSFRYRASASSTGYVVQPAVLAPNHKVVTAYPAGPRPVLSSGGRQQSMTIELRLAKLEGGVTYALKNNPDFSGGLHLNNQGKLPNGSISVSQVMFSLQAWAA
jgi:hypothetical protein